MTATAAWAGRTALVTGAHGFIGAWVAERLLDAGARVVVPRRDAAPATRLRSEGIEARCRTAAVDLRDAGAVARVLADHDVDAVFHLAARSAVGTAAAAPLATLESNVRATWALLDACRARAGALRCVVVASSDHAYGAHAVPALHEDLGLRGLSPYDVSKRCADLVARSYAHTYGLPVAVTRFANVFGAGDLQWSRLVPGTARRLVAGRAPVIRSDGTPERDLLHVEDAADAYLLLAAAVESRPELAGRAWNAGLGRGVPVLELVRRLVAVSGRDVEPEVRGHGTPTGEVDRLVLDSTAIREELGWAPRWALDDALAATYAWYERLLAPPAASAA